MLMEQENWEILQEENLSQSSLDEKEAEKKRKKEVIFELALFLILGFLIGITVKTEAVKRVTMGFNDYQVSVTKNYNISEIKKELVAKMAEQQIEAQTQPQVQQ